MKTFIKTKHAIALLLIVTAGIPAVLLADSFTPAEKREINVDTPGLFEKSKSFSVDFTTLKESEYSFPLAGGKAPDQPQMRKALDTAQRVRVLIGLFEHDFRACFRHDAALAGNAEFLRKVAADSGDDFDRFHYFTSTDGTSTPESCIVCIMCRCAARRARSLSCSRIPRYISKWHWLAR